MAFTDILSKVIKGLNFLPAIIHGVEALFGSGNGAQKKATAQDIALQLVGGADALTGAGIDPQKASDSLGGIIDAVVAFFNAVGIFKKSSSSSSSH